MEAPSQQVGTRVLFENDVIRVWDFTLEPGEVSRLHRHVHDYFFVYLTDDNELEVRVPDKEPSPVSTPSGYVAYVGVGPGTDPNLTHSLANVGDRAHRQIVVELCGTHPSPDAEPVMQTSDAGSDAWADRRSAGGEET
jgi:beta-alanine degradation protein BauB